MTTLQVQRENLLLYGAIVIAAVLLPTAAISAQVSAQTTIVNGTASKNSTSAAVTGASPNASPIANFTGSIPLRSTISEAISSKVKTSLSDAVTIAQQAIGPNTSVTLAFIRTLNGYLVYDVHVKNNSNDTTTAVIVDAGNGKVLYTQTPPSLRFGDFGFGHLGRGFGDRDSTLMGPMGPSVPTR